MSDRRIPLATPTMNGSEMDYIREAFDTNWIAPLGKNVDMFENELAGYVGAPYAAALSSGTAAIHLAVRNVFEDGESGGFLRSGTGRVIFCSALTFAASVNPVAYENAVPVFIDSEPGTWNMSPRALEAAFEKYPHPAAVIVVHLYGIPARIEEICEICRAHGVPVIEDAAEALGTTVDGRFLGRFGKFGIYSFNGNKIITTSGGGMLISDEKCGIDRARNLATQARQPFPYYQHTEIGCNYRMSNICAGIGRGQLHTLEDHIARKRAIYDFYRREFADLPLEMMPEPENSRPNCWLSAARITDSHTPAQLIAALGEKNIEARHIWKPMQLQPVFDGCDYFSDGDFSRRVFDDGLCLPSDIKMTEDDLCRIRDTVRAFFAK